MLFPVLLFVFRPNFRHFQYSTTLFALFLFQQKSKQPYVVSHGTKHQIKKHLSLATKNKHALFRMKQNTKQ